MSAETLRRAAALMRERAEAATPGGPRWETAADEMHGPSQAIIFPADSDSAVAFAGADDAEHIASWHPAAAHAVAELLEGIAEVGEVRGDWDHYELGIRALAAARVYLGGE